MQLRAKIELVQSIELLSIGTQMRYHVLRWRILHATSIINVTARVFLTTKRAKDIKEATKPDHILQEKWDRVRNGWRVSDKKNIIYY
jgi:hypothetical protein